MDCKTILSIIICVLAVAGIIAYFFIDKSLDKVCDLDDDHLSLYKQIEKQKK